MNMTITHQRRQNLANIERDPYQAAMLTWLEGKADNTRRSYMTAMRAFLDFTGEHPKDTTPLQVAA